MALLKTIPLTGIVKHLEKKAETTSGQKVKIALAHKRLELRGGNERVLYRTAQGLRDRGHEVHLFCGRFLIPAPEGVFAHRVPCISWPRTARLLSFAVLSPKIIARNSCDAVMSLDGITRQDVYRSSGGPHRRFIQKMAQDRGRWKALWYGISPYHRPLLMIERWPLELKSKIVRFLDPARWSSLSQQARQLSEKFSWQRYTWTR
jgi:hypothetical protein